MSNMKKLSLSFLSLTLVLVLAACGGGSPPTDNSGDAGGGAVVTPTTATLTLTITGVASAPVKVTDSSGAVIFDGTVGGSKALSNLPRGGYTVAAGSVANYIAPAVQPANLAAGDSTITLAYTALPGTGLDANTVSGVIPNWTLGKASALVAHVLTTTTGQYSRSTGLVSPAGTVAADGALNISLPASIDPSYISAFFPTNSSCTFTGTATDPTFQSDWYANKLIQVGDSPLGKVQEFVSGSPADNRHIVVRVYVPADVTVKGTYSCNPGTVDAFADTYDLTLSKGWNAVEFVKNSDTEYQYRMLAAGARIELQYQSFTPGIQFTLSDTSGLTLKRGDKVTRTVKIVQVGGYSGTVSLATNVPGVTVDPSTVSLNPVTSQTLTSLVLHAQTNPSALQRLEQVQSIGTASVATTMTFTAGADAAPHNGTPNDLFTAKDASGTTLGSVSLPITVSVPSATVVLNYGSGVTLDRGQTVSVPVNIYGNNGYVGPVVVSLENLPDGVTASSVQTTTGGATIPTISFSATATAAAGKKVAQLIVNSGGVVTRSDVQVTVSKPSVSVNFNSNGYSGLTIRRGQTKNFSVQVVSQHGFSGSTTVSLKGLPAGVTAAPLTLNVTAGATTNATLAVTASDSATYGSAVVQVNDDDLDTSSPPQISLVVASAVTIVPSEAVRIGSASSGLWVMNQNGQYISTGGTYGYNYTVKRYENNKVKVDITVFIDGGSNSYPLTTPSGDLVVFGNTKIYIIKTDGTMSNVKGDSGASYYAKVIDSQNRLWYPSYKYGNSATLATLDLSTGVQTPVSGIAVSDSYFRIYRNTTGNTLYFIPNSSGYTGTITQIDSATSAKTKDISLPGVSSVGVLAISQDGTVWGGTSYSGVFRVNSDTTLTLFSSLSSPSKLVFDAIDPKVLWSYSGSTVYKIDTSTGTASSIPAGGGVSDLAADSQGGVWASGNEDNYSSNPSYYVSLIK